VSVNSSFRLRSSSSRVELAHFRLERPLWAARCSQSWNVTVFAIIGKGA
jgi:hypothetical protein